MSVLAVLAAAVLFGTTGTAQALSPAGTTPLSVGAARLVVGGAVLALAAASRGGRHAPATRGDDPTRAVQADPPRRGSEW